MTHVDHLQENDIITCLLSFLVVLDWHLKAACLERMTFRGQKAFFLDAVIVFQCLRQFVVVGNDHDNRDALAGSRHDWDYGCH
mmetsp:Transcript_11994/g.18224  ORF Transcript_11994/g.18224 Transcript_11994/m.18224 type:complete len:83 (-) Transcript_11994:1265-1513(-)